MPSRLTVYQRNVPPIDRMMTRCKVCSQWVDADRTQSPEEAPGVHKRVEGMSTLRRRPGGEIDFARD